MPNLENLQEILKIPTTMPKQFVVKTVKCVYFFAGQQRKGDVKFWLQKFCGERNWELIMEEFDLLRPGSNNDLSIPSVQKQWMEKLAGFQLVLNTPPCSSFSRAVWANSRGPCPVRSSRFPQGFPWLSKELQVKAELGNSLLQFMWHTFEAIHSIMQTTPIIGFGEHPEDLGRIPNGGPGDCPASAWQTAEFSSLVRRGWWSGGFKQDKFGAPTPKPTRAIANSQSFLELAPASVPTFTDDGFYLGPIPKSKGPHTVSLLRKPGDSGPFRTAASAAYPSDLCKMIAHCMIRGLENWTPSVRPSEGGINPPKTSATIQVEVSKPSFPPAPPKATVCRFSFSHVDKRRLEDRLLEENVLTSSLKDPPSRREPSTPPADPGPHTPALDVADNPHGSNGQESV